MTTASSGKSGKRSVVLTGGRGFVGKRLTAALTNAGFHVFSVVRPGSSALSEVPGLTWILSGDAAGIYDAHRPEATIHLATCYGHSGQVSDVIESNILLPMRLLEASAGIADHLFVNTDTFFAKPRFGYTHMAAYVKSKQAVLAWAELALKIRPQVRFVNARLEHVYGPGDGAAKFVPHVIDKLSANQPIAMTPGDQVRDFVHVDDVVGAYLAIIDAKERLPAGFVEIEIGTGMGTTLRSFVEQAKTICGSSSTLSFGALPHREGEIMASVADTAGLASIAWSARHTVESGLHDTIDATRRESSNDA